MTEQREHHEGSERRHIGGELVIPIAALAFTLYYFVTIAASPWTAQVSAFFVGTILIVLILVFFIRAGLLLRRGSADLRLDGLFAPTRFINKRLGLLALTIGYIAVIRWLGFTITTFLFLTLAMFMLTDGRRKRLVLGLSLVLSLGGYLLFVVAFQTRFPAGPFEHLIGTIF
jgi:hypothetical protein